MSSLSSLFSPLIIPPKQMGSLEILIFGESESTAKDHMSDVIANRSEP